MKTRGSQSTSAEGSNRAGNMQQPDTNTDPPQGAPSLGRMETDESEDTHTQKRKRTNMAENDKPHPTRKEGFMSTLDTCAKLITGIKEDTQAIALGARSKDPLAQSPGVTVQPETLPNLHIDKDICPISQQVSTPQLIETINANNRYMADQLSHISEVYEATKKKAEVTEKLIEDIHSIMLRLLKFDDNILEHNQSLSTELRKVTTKATNNHLELHSIKEKQTKLEEEQRKMTMENDEKFKQQDNKVAEMEATINTNGGQQTSDDNLQYEIPLDLENKISTMEQKIDSLSQDNTRRKDDAQRSYVFVARIKGGTRNIRRLQDDFYKIANIDELMKAKILDACLMSNDRMRLQLANPFLAGAIARHANINIAACINRGIQAPRSMVGISVYQGTPPGQPQEEQKKLVAFGKQRREEGAFTFFTIKWDNGRRRPFLMAFRDETTADRAHYVVDQEDGTITCDSRNFSRDGDIIEGDFRLATDSENNQRQTQVRNRNARRLNNQGNMRNTPRNTGRSTQQEPSSQSGDNSRSNRQEQAYNEHGQQESRHIHFTGQNDPPSRREYLEGTSGDNNQQNIYGTSSGYTDNSQHGSNFGNQSQRTNTHDERTPSQHWQQEDPWQQQGRQSRRDRINRQHHTNSWQQNQQQAPTGPARGNHTRGRGRGRGQRATTLPPSNTIYPGPNMSGRRSSELEDIRQPYVDF